METLAFLFFLCLCAVQVIFFIVAGGIWQDGHRLIAVGVALLPMSLFTLIGILTGL